MEVELSYHRSGSVALCSMQRIATQECNAPNTETRGGTNVTRSKVPVACIECRCGAKKPIQMQPESSAVPGTKLSELLDDICTVRAMLGGPVGKWSWYRLCVLAPYLCL
mmetsp:Transcript_29343/g.68951  ORF Transcript_29343/g.68951 Transcript_29343/m.68951 type:complete len:109 (-) Transcript_29343:278-604(-)|eukprot:CAMPEP_0172388906 /NCGR_PEP_ID=MMETSP1061-20121228/5913_1 /TAXON_ID=37318 /ORGANISM="Pseudo-nitzschia pungens, Strain cf. pungens" /LENGTH=108 /DNA_ID=CAMNT_0013118921 /DNA_START=77 /DNA_END=403 /DNA_ORIENTATION=-